MINTKPFLCDSVYWVLFTGETCSLFSQSPSNSDHFTAKHLFYIWIYQNKIPNSEIIASQIGKDTENRKDFT